MTPRTDPVAPARPEDAARSNTDSSALASQAPVETPFVNRRDPARTLGPDGSPAVSRRAPLWADVPDEQWNDWRWQLSRRVNTLEEIGTILRLTDEEIEGLS